MARKMRMAMSDIRVTHYAAEYIGSRYTLYLFVGDPLIAETVGGDDSPTVTLTWDRNPSTNQWDNCSITLPYNINHIASFRFSAKALESVEEHISKDKLLEDPGPLDYLDALEKMCATELVYDVLACRWSTLAGATPANYRLFSAVDANAYTTIMVAACDSKDAKRKILEQFTKQISSATDIKNAADFTRDLQEWLSLGCPIQQIPSGFQPGWRRTAREKAEDPDFCKDESPCEGDMEVPNSV